MSEPDNGERTIRDERFVQLITSVQIRLLHYIAMLLGDPNEAGNVLQETNLVLWKKANEFTPGTNFSAWAHKIAYWQVQAYVRDRKRDRLVFDEAVIEQLASNYSEVEVDPEMRIALRHCLSKISSQKRDLLKLRYEQGLSIKALSEKIKKSPSATKTGLMRVRRALMNCINHNLDSAS